MDVKKHTEVLGTLPIGKLIFRIAVPSSVALFVTSTYNLVDAMFVGRGVGPEAIGAITLVWPLQMVVMALGGMLAVGSSSIVSRSLGAQEHGQAKLALGNAIVLSIGLGFLATLGGEVLLGPLVQILGASGPLIGPTRNYLQVLLLTEPIILINLSTNALIRAEGQAKIAMSTMIAGMLINIALDPIFIFGFGWGMRGAALATLIGRSATLLLVIIFYRGNRSTLKVGKAHLRPNRGILSEMIKVGSSAFVRQFSTGFVNGVRNNLLVAHGGAAFISAFGAAFRIIVFLGMPGMGIAQALQPIAGYNYGAGNTRRVRQSLWASIGACTLFMGIGFVIVQMVPGNLLQILSSDRYLLAEGTKILRVSAILLLVFPTYFLAPSFYQALGKPGRALLLSLTRPIVGVVAMIAAVKMLGAMGAVASDPLSVAIAALVGIAYLRSSLKRLGSESPVTLNTR